MVTVLLLTVLLLVVLSDDESDPEASEFDLGTKIKTPKDVMLEELSLLNNKGSKMFRMRQQRVEKFIVTNEDNVGASTLRGAFCFAPASSFCFCPPAEPPEPADVSSSTSSRPPEAGDPEAGRYWSFLPASIRTSSF